MNLLIIGLEIYHLKCSLSKQFKPKNKTCSPFVSAVDDLIPCLDRLLWLGLLVYSTIREIVRKCKTYIQRSNWDTWNFLELLCFSQIKTEQNYMLGYKWRNYNLKLNHYKKAKITPSQIFTWGLCQDPLHFE